MIRTTLVVVALLTLVTGRAEADERLPHQLEASDIERVTSKSLDAVRACYQPHSKNKKATGKVEVKLIIHRDGTPFRIDVKTPGLKSRKLSACVAAIASDWRFPMRRGFTHTAVPFYFLRTHVAGAGPQYSCWKKTGCPGKERAARGPSSNDGNPRLSKKAD